MSGQPIVVLDNGAGTCKIGFGGESAPRKVFPNCTAKPKGERAGYVGDMLMDSKEISQLTLRRPFDRGYLVSWDLEREIWGRAFKSVLGLGKQGSGLQVSDCGLLLSEPMFNFEPVQLATEQIVFEEFGFASYWHAPAPYFSLRHVHSYLASSVPALQAGCGVVVDAGFSFMHVVPYFNWNPVMQGVRRIDIGGKALTNYLKELVSYRCLNMMDEPYLMELVKESVCFVSRDVRNDLKLASTRRSPHRREFVLPDGVNNTRGYVRPVDPPEQPAADPVAAAAGGQPGPGPSGSAAPPGAPSQPGPASAGGSKAARPAAVPGEQVLVLNNERFMVPELAFHPSDIGLQQAGIAEAVKQAVSAVSPALQSLLYSNVVLTGGLVACPGFSDRFSSELRPLVPDDFYLGVHTPPDPITCAWQGMSAFATYAYHGCAKTKAQYEEQGPSNTRTPGGR